MHLVRCTCGQVLSCQDELAGQYVSCPYCEARTLVQAAPQPQPHSSDDLFPDLSAVGLVPEDPPARRVELDAIEDDRTPYDVRDSGADAVAGIVGEMGAIRVSGQPLCRCLAYAANHLIALAGAKRSVHVFSLRRLDRVGKFMEHGAAVTAVAISANGELALSGDEHGNIWLWEIATRQALRRFPAHVRAVSALAFAPSGAYAVSGGLDGITRLWDLSAGTDIPLQQARWQAPVNCVAFAPDGGWLLAGSDHGLLYVWSARTGAPRQRLMVDMPVDSAAFATDGDAVVAASVHDRDIGTWDLASASRIDGLDLRRVEIEDALVVPAGLRVLTVGMSYDDSGTSVLGEFGTGSAVLQHWNIAHGQDVSTFSYGQSGHLALAVAPDGSRCLTAGDDGILRIWGLM